MESVQNNDSQFFLVERVKSVAPNHRVGLCVDLHVYLHDSTIQLGLGMTSGMSFTLRELLVTD